MTRTTRLGLDLAGILMLCLLLAGCDSGPALAPVVGTVTLDGSPLAAAEVEFQPTAAGGSPSVGVTDADGHYELRFTMNEKGALLGEHTVRIIMAEEDDDEGGTGTNEGPPTARIPARYNTNSELKETVQKGKNTFDFLLESGQ